MQHLEAKRKLHSLIVCNVLLSFNTGLHVCEIVSNDVVGSSMWRSTEVSWSLHVTLNGFCLRGHVHILYHRPGSDGCAIQARIVSG